MKKLFLLLSVAMLSFTACSDDDNNPGGDQGKTVHQYVDATAKDTWNYYSFEKQAVVGVGAENAEDNAAWAKRTDWDMAINRYQVRTNSGAATSVNAKGGLYTCEAGVTLESLTQLPAGAKFEADKAVTEPSMAGGEVTTVKSTAVVAVMEGMPPIWHKAPLYVIRTADGKGYVKVQFTHYKNDKGESGHVQFDFAKL